MTKIEMYCVTNKKVKLLEDIPYNLAAVGKSNFTSDYIKCDKADNIFHKEKYYSELTFHYWYWKNKLQISESKWIGFCQKRRFWLKKNTNDDISVSPCSSRENYYSRPNYIYHFYGFFV